ncbi:MAG: helix-turn-helix domain-containing protein [Desulfobacterales bacterium]
MGAHKKYEIALTGAQKEHLEKYIRTGGKSARKIARARILLSCPEGRTYRQTAESLKVCQMTVFNTVKRFAESGLDFTPDGKPFPELTPRS